MNRTEGNVSVKDSIAKRISLKTSLIILVFGMILMSLAIWRLSDTVIKAYYGKLEDICDVLSKRIDGDKMNEYIRTQETDEYYDSLKEELDTYKTETEGISYIYVFVPYDDYFLYIAEGERESDDHELTAKFLERFEYRDFEYKYFVPDLKEQIGTTKPQFQAEKSLFRGLSAWKPIFDSKGNLAAYIEADYIPYDIWMPVLNTVKIVFVVFVLGIVILLLLLLKIIRKDVVIPLDSITKFASSYEDGSFKVNRPELLRDDEFKLLSDTMDTMGQNIDKYIKELTFATAERERIGTELNLATRIQASYLPSVFPPFPNRSEVDLFATMDPAKEVGGDFYDFFMLDDDHLGLVMADVSGKGVPAALFMMISKTLIKNNAQYSHSPAEILTLVNNQLCENNEAEMFVTVWLGILQISTGIMKAASAGHEYPCIKKAGGKYELFKDKHGFVIGGMEGIKYKEYELIFEPGDSLYVYTDGVAEATNADNELFGTDRMLEALNLDSEADVLQVTSNVRRAIDEFVKEAPQFDDITMLAFKYMGK